MKKIESISDYLRFVKETDRLPVDDLGPVLHGLFGEVGGLMTAAKKTKREPKTYTAFDNEVIEEFGDAFWYLCCIAIRLNVDMLDVFRRMAAIDKSVPDVLIGLKGSPISLSYTPEGDESFDDVLVSLGQQTGNFLSSEYVSVDSEEKILSFVKTFIRAIYLLDLDFEKIILINTVKVSSRFIRPKNEDLPRFDEKFEEFERLPDNFEIEFVKRTASKQALRWNGVFIGDPLTDSIKDPDGYRFHDVFHFSYASILHWSPTFRALIKHKRKSAPEIDQTQDGGRAIVVEEGLSAWIFNIAKDNNLFANQNSLTFDMLKNVEQIVRGFEVDACPLILWEEAILKGYEVFRLVIKNEGGSIIGNRKSRTLEYVKRRSPK